MREKMKISGIICELNPLHEGHIKLFSAAKAESDALICVLSGNFVQRGDVAILDKWARTKAALLNGADLVLELPTPWAMSGAEKFARGAVYLLNSLGCVNFLFFGSETDDIGLLSKSAEILLSEKFKEVLHSIPDNGETFAARREGALASILEESYLPTLRMPNSILGIEYIKAINELSANILPRAVLREGSPHDGDVVTGTAPSSGTLRKMLLSGEDCSKFLPNTAVIGELKSSGSFPCDVHNLERAILCKIRTLTPKDFSKLPDVSEGLENRLWHASREARTLEEFCETVKTKRYTLSRIRRVLLWAFLGYPENIPALPPYIRILGLNDTGEKILRNSSPTLPIIARYGDLQNLSPVLQSLYRFEAYCDDLYALSSPIPQPCGRDFTESVIRI